MRDGFGGRSFGDGVAQMGGRDVGLVAIGGGGLFLSDDIGGGNDDVGVLGFGDVANVAVMDGFALMFAGGIFHR